jgi:hypothetical protein
VDAKSWMMLKNFWCDLWDVTVDVDMTLSRESALLRRAWNPVFRSQGWRLNTASMPILFGNG